LNSHTDGQRGKLVASTHRGGSTFAGCSASGVVDSVDCGLLGRPFGLAANGTSGSASGLVRLRVGTFPVDVRSRHARLAASERVNEPTKSSTHDPDVPGQGRSLSVLGFIVVVIIGANFTR
jgi:hypothetical protein